MQCIQNAATSLETLVNAAKIRADECVNETKNKK